MGVGDRCDGESVVEVADGVAHVFVDQVGVDGDGRRGAGAGGGDDLGAGSAMFPAARTPGDTGAPGGVDGDPAVGVDVVTSLRPTASSSAGAVPSRERYPCRSAAAALRGFPASTTRTVRRARDRTRAPDRPAAPPPMTTTSY